MWRRSILGVLIAGAGTMLAAAVGLSALVAGMSPALKPRREKWRPLGRLGEFPVGAVREAAIAEDPKAWPKTRPQAAFVWRQGETDLVVFSRSCTDLGCALNFDAGSRCYFCPCHGGIFAHDGERMAGPPNRPMDRYTHRLRGDVIEVDVASLPPTA